MGVEKDCSELFKTTFIDLVFNFQTLFCGGMFDFVFSPGPLLLIQRPP